MIGNIQKKQENLDDMWRRIDQLIKFQQLTEQIKVVMTQDDNAYELAQLDGELFRDFVNGNFLKHFL